MKVSSERVSFPGALGESLAARLDSPSGEIRAYALFAHCFTCSKDIFAASRIAAALAERGIAVLRFDFTGLGASDGDFANTNFSSNVADLIAAVDWLRDNRTAPSLLIGHSLGGAAILAAAPSVEEAKAVATIGAPADPEHVAHNFALARDEIEAQGEAEVTLAGRNFRIKKQFLDDIATAKLQPAIEGMRKALIVFHSPRDETVSVDNASNIFLAAKHPKSFVSLDDADHLLTRRSDAIYVAEVLAAWASRYIGAAADAAEAGPTKMEPGDVLVEETRRGKFTNKVTAGAHVAIMDEPTSVGGFDSGMNPYDMLLAGLGGCTSMTLRMYAERKGLPLDRVAVRLSHKKIHAQDCEECETKVGKVDLIDRELTLTGDLDAAQRQRLLEIADMCPVHRTLESENRIVTKLRD